MKFINSIVTRATFLALFIATPIAAVAGTLEDIKARGTLRAAIDLASPPFGMQDASMQPTGSEVETAKLLADSLGVKLQIVEVTSPNRIPFLQTSKADIVVASLSVTDERKKVIDFADPHGVIKIIVAAPASMAIKSLDDLKGKDVATTRGTSNDKEATTQAKDANIVRYDDDATLVTALVSGQNDIMISAPQILNAVNQRRTNDPLETKLVLKVNPYAIGLRKGDDELKTTINEWVHANLKNGKLNEIYKKYNNLDLPSDMLK
ncbi:MULTISPECIES: transporter substrate-binding domain-containing protein [unclassified Mesorhizobium]|uniref:transporter substrate-binding domain-containing protein n=1 Tax=unclassified Mesorhizobium TaxID=325217 RepID=UPI000BAFB666|nr:MULTISPECIES: transporter substrate-binding domain-containing protein [unclassified Mesorhizobium]TGT63635.1 transporter substrate-binding domain-containing protein [Mesorhizobium sp. M00.F.Ca.ET.170.01.1.1]AZO11279.1 transporter substrate-binding domain-containing protein [Mesorhizobium sp. M3A.F.Ca.ET.080.04.2.1]PBB88470.1 amino acid ABC transporter [Mesorhizobium sp. WSM3876]RWB76597.1 MAG: transporter substrate-binding domain-containing protein [Mesorhizobium sp.]RWB92226.1 MAG: transpo